MGDKVAHIAIDHLANKFSIDGAQELPSGIIGAIGGIKGMAAGLFGGSIVAKFLGLLREPTEHFLAKHINDMLKKQRSGNRVQYDRRRGGQFLDYPCL